MSVRFRELLWYSNEDPRRPTCVGKGDAYAWLRPSEIASQPTQARTNGVLIQVG